MSMASAKAIVKKAIHDEKTTKAVLLETYRDKPKEKPASRKQAVTLAKLRSGHHVGLQACKAIIKKTDPTCPSCREEPETLAHWLQDCPATAVMRNTIFGDPSPPLSIINTDPGGVMKYVGKTIHKRD